MQTQIQHSSKKNKVTVPFYSPPCKLHGHTSADIIKEARAAIMTTSPVGIKPVFTTRPFTPNQKERTLFGNVKKSKSRPPSTFSLRHLRSQEPSCQIKLPSINTVSRKKNFSFQYSKNLSLDNLTEDYDAEVFEEVRTFNNEKLLTWKKSFSSPIEGRLLKVASMSDLGHPSINVNKNEGNSVKNGNSEMNRFDYNSKVTEFLGEPIKLEEDVGNSKQNQENPMMTKGGGDYKDPGANNLNLMACNNKDDSKVEVIPFGDVCDESEQKIKQNKNQKLENENDIIRTTENKNIIKEESCNKLLESQSETVETLKQNKDFQENKQSQKNEHVAEKSVATGFKSEYLTSLKSGFKNADIVNQPKPVSLEILQLHETAKYYGVDINESHEEPSVTVTNLSNKAPFSLTEQLNNNKIKGNLSKSSELGKNESTESPKDGIRTNTQVNKMTQEDSSEGTIEFVMNNKKRYHVVGDKGNAKEKAYKKWNDNQEQNNIPPQSKISKDSWDLFWKNSYYRDKDENEEKSKRDISEESLQHLVNRIVGLIKKGAENSKIFEATSQLYGLIKNNKIILNTKLKEGISKALYMNVDNENAKVLISLAKVLFILKEENCLSVACKIIFKVARFDTNDHLFLNEEDILELLLEGIGRASPLDCAESCIYGYGALKFLTLNHGILSRILHMGALDLMTLHLKMINNYYVENGNVGEQTQHALFQLTGALRHVAAGEGALPLFLTTNCITIVCGTLRYFYTDEDVTINISRTLSLLSTDEIVTQALMEVQNILNLLIDLIERYKENDKILIRLAFCLGNIVEHSDLARVQLSRSDTALSVLLNVLKLYIDKDLEISLKDSDSLNAEDLSSEVVDDIIVKVIRIIANMSMNPIVGSNLSPGAEEKKSLQLSKLLSLLLMRKDPGITLLATLGCLNNISYYCNTHSVLIDITQGVERVLGLKSIECQVEAARVLGNLTRHKEIRDLIYSTGGVDLLIKLISSADQEVVRSACGALVNMMLDSETRKSFVKAQGIDKLVRTLEVFPNDWSLASLATRAIWNSCGDDVSSALLHNNVENLLNLLVRSLEEENWNDGDVAWEEFASVATDLLDKISFHLEST